MSRERSGKSGERAARIMAIVILSSLASSCATPVIEIANPDLTKARDGAWRGFYDGGLVKVEVEVVTAARRIESVAILRHDCGKGKPAEAIAADIVESQSLAVDAISGATFSSKCILKAAQLALDKSIE